MSEPPQPSPPAPKQAAWYRYTDAASLGIEIAVSVTLCALIANWLERNVTHWAPWTSLIGICIGLGAATKAVVRTARNYRRELQRMDAEAREAEAQEAEAQGKDQDDDDRP